MASINLPSTSSNSPVDIVGTRLGVTLHEFTVTFRLIEAKKCKEEAQASVDEAVSSQKKAEECADMIDKVQAGQANIDGVNMPDVTRKYFYVNSLSCDTAGDAKALDNNIKTLKNFQRSIDSNTERLLANAQDLVGRCHSYLEGVNPTS